MAAIGLLVLRLALGAILAAHGAHKLFGTFAGPGAGPGGLDQTTASFAALGLQPSFALAVAAGVIQFTGGIAIALGALTRLAASAALLYLLVGIWADHARWGLFLNWVGDPTRGHGMEYSIVIAGVLVCLLFAGAGDFSIDGLRAKSVASRAAGRARIRGHG